MSRSHTIRPTVSARRGRPGRRGRHALVAVAATIGLLGPIGLIATSGPATADPSPGPVPAPASPSPSANPGSAPSQGPAVASRQSRRRGPSYQRRHHVVCVKGPDGHLLDCPAQVRHAQRPRGARKQTMVRHAVTDPATMVDARTWTSGGGNTFPGAEAPFGMVQWSPDTVPNRSAGGGYTFGDPTITGYSLTHVSGPGCGAGGDVPMLPITGALPSGNPNDVTTSFSNDGEVAQAGYYEAKSNQPDTITSEFTATPHSSMARFTYPSGSKAGFLIKLHDSQNGEYAPSTASIVDDHEISGSETSGHFCGEPNNDGQQQEYTVHFDITFDQPFATSKVIAGGDGTPDAVYVTFDTAKDNVVRSKVGISYVSTANAQQNWQQENPGWDFGAVRSTTQKSWNDLLGRMQVSGGSFARTQMFYSLLYKDFIQPNISSDVNGQYMGADMSVHTLAKGQHDQYGIYSGWDTYHSLAQLQAMLDPAAASDQAQSLVNYYDQDQILQQWGYLNLNNYVMVGDPAQSIIADYYAFGAKSFDTSGALHDMLEQATTTNDVRPGQGLEDKLGYLPEDGSYRNCCNPHGFVSSRLEYDSEDLALGRFAAALGDQNSAAMLERRANNWENVFNPANGLLNPRNADGSFVPGISRTTTSHYVEGSAYEYLWNVPNNYPALFSLLGGRAKADAALKEFLSRPNGFGEYAQLTNEFGFGEQYALDYARDPAATQRIVNKIRNTMYQPGPSLENNDDLGANSSTYIWEMLGMYPENSGADTLVFNSPGFPHAQISLPGGKSVTINAPGASPTNYYVQNLKLDGRPYHQLSVPFSRLAQGATLDWTLGSQPSDWGTAPQDAPPAYGAGTEPFVGYSSTERVVLAPGESTTVELGAQNATQADQKVGIAVAGSAGIDLSPSSGKVNLPPSGKGSLTVRIHAPADTSENFYRVTSTLTTSSGQHLAGPTLTVLVAKPGSLLRAFDNVGVSDDSAVHAADFDGGGWSYSAQALAAQGVKPRSTVKAGDITYSWPPSAPGEPDNAVASGQQVKVSAQAGTRQLGFLGSANGGPSQGLVTLAYADGSTAEYWLGFSDWTLNAGRSEPAYGNQVAISTPYRNCSRCSSGRDNVATHVFSAVVPVDPGKSLTSVTLPQGATQGQLHVFAIGTSAATPSGPVVSSLSPSTASAADRVTIHGTGFGASQGDGYVKFSDGGVNWGAPGNNATFHVDSWSDTAITFTVPQPSGPDGEWHVSPGTTAMVTVVNGSGDTSGTAALDITPTADPADYYDNTGISDDGDASCDADFDGDGYSYSAQALEAAGAAPGGTITVDGLSYTWPDVPSCRPDNILAHGQTMLVHATAGATKLGLLGSSANGSSQGQVTVHYRDGSSDTATLHFTDWAQAPSNGDIAALTTPYRNEQGGGTQQITMYVDAAEVPVDAAKTVTSVTLPSVADHVSSNASMHVFAVTMGG